MYPGYPGYLSIGTVLDAKLHTLTRVHCVHVCMAMRCCNSYTCTYSSTRVLHVYNRARIHTYVDLDGVVAMLLRGNDIDIIASAFYVGVGSVLLDCRA